MNTKSLRFRSEVYEEVHEAFDYYFKKSPALAEELLIEIEESLQLILAQPLLYPPYTKKTSRRILRVFPYFIVFQVKEECILIIAIAHAKRRPGYWHKQI